MLAVRDQENLVHGHQTAAATKPLNQISRQPPPKTPGNRVPKTPLKIPLNDENENNGLRAGKGTIKTKGDLKHSFVTPTGTKNRAPLGAKTTNAKTKAFQTPAPPFNDDLAKTKKNSISAQKPKPKPKPVETTKLEVLGDKEIDDVPDIEYMPPRSKDLPDIPEDHVEHDLSVFEGNIFKGAGSYLVNLPGYDGISPAQRQEQEEKDKFNLLQARIEAKAKYENDRHPMSCIHYPECPGEVCKDEIDTEKLAKEEFDCTMAMLNAEAAPKKDGKKLGKTAPSTIKSKEAAQALSKPTLERRMPDPVKKPAPTAIKNNAIKPTTASSTKTAAPKPRMPLSKKAPTPTNPSTFRHNAAVAGSKTTIGPSKGRAVSATLKARQQPAAPKGKAQGFVPFEERDSSIDATMYWQRYGTPPRGSEMWLQCWKQGFVGPQSEEATKRRKEEEEEEKREREERENAILESVRKDALEDFHLTL